MTSMLSPLKAIIVLFLLYSSLVFGKDYSNSNDPQILIISPQIALPIGVKIWFNESGGSVDGLTAWNDGEDFASLGIGHFVWLPYSQKNKNRASFNSGFPKLVRYIEKKGGKAPLWLRGAIYCPWSTRQEFLQAQNSPRMAELRLFLQKTIPIQAECMVKHLEEILPELLASAPPEDRQFIYHKFHTLARTPAGIYALVDYLNFKGAGISSSLQNYKHGSGLLHVLKGMKFAPPNSTPLQAYVWSAKNALIRRVERASPSSHHERWLGGWFNRLNTYLEGDYLGTTQLAIN
ncbi:MAG: hypothetical protein ACD_21C00067G0005 [uncultured bacterium]|nr:MAG: hypothetical protein ACD_21C00067G0005 [uncultured bacterium]